MTTTDEYATLRAAFHAGARIQAWTLNTGAKFYSDGYWRDVGKRLDGERMMPEFSCPAHLYRIHPEDGLRAMCILLKQQIAALEPQA